MGNSPDNNKLAALDEKMGLRFQCEKEAREAMEKIIAHRLASLERNVASTVSRTELLLALGTMTAIMVLVLSIVKGL